MANPITNKEFDAILKMKFPRFGISGNEQVKSVFKTVLDVLGFRKSNADLNFNTVLLDDGFYNYKHGLLQVVSHYDPETNAKTGTYQFKYDSQGISWRVIQLVQEGGTQIYPTWQKYQLLLNDKVSLITIARTTSHNINTILGLEIGDKVFQTVSKLIYTAKDTGSGSVRLDPDSGIPLDVNTVYIIEGIQYIYSSVTDSLVSLLENISTYKVYSAEFTQSGVNPLVVDILDNTVGDIVWTKVGIGDYLGTLTGAFADKKVVCVQNNTYNLSYSDKKYFLVVIKANDNTISIKTFDENIDPIEDDALFNKFIEIRVY